MQNNDLPVQMSRPIRKKISAHVKKLKKKGCMKAAVTVCVSFISSTYEPKKRPYCSV